MMLIGTVFIILSILALTIRITLKSDSCFFKGMIVAFLITIFIILSVMFIGAII